MDTWEGPRGVRLIAVSLYIFIFIAVAFIYNIPFSDQFTKWKNTRAHVNIFFFLLFKTNMRIIYSLFTCNKHF